MVKIKKNDLLVCVGGGKWGTTATMAARESQAKAIVVDPNPNCPVSRIADAILVQNEIKGKTIEAVLRVVGREKGVWKDILARENLGWIFPKRGILLVVDDGIEILMDILRWECPDWVIPAIPRGIAGRLTEKWLIAKQLKVKKSALLTRKALTSLPERLILSADENSATIVSSYMPNGLWCKVPCSYPESCPVTGRRRIAPMYEFLKFASSEVVAHYKIFVTEDIGGIGAIPGAEVKEWLKYLEELELPCSIAVGTSCNCHGLLTFFEVEKDVASHSLVNC